MDNAEKYLLHCAGVYTMLAWMERQNDLGTGNKVSEQTIYISQLGSRYFALGTSTHKKARYPYLAIQPNEAQWIDMIQWDYLAYREEDHYLYLVSSIVKGDNITYPDIPVFAIGVHFDLLDKLDLIKNYSKVDGREYFIDTDGLIRVNYHNKLFSLELKKFKKDEPYLKEGKVTNYSDIMTSKESALQSVFGAEQPEFKGEIADIPESRGLLDKLKENERINKIYNDWYKKK